MIARTVGTRPTDLLVLLADIRLDCPGAVRLCRPEEEAFLAKREDLLQQMRAPFERAMESAH